MMEIITSAKGLVVGDVLFIAKRIQPRGKDEFWWRAYWIVTECMSSRWVGALLLKMNPDLDKDRRTFDFDEEVNDQVIQYLHPDDYPQGVQAMRIKLIAQGRIKLAS